MTNRSDKRNKPTHSKPSPNRIDRFSNLPAPTSHTTNSCISALTVLIIGYWLMRVLIDSHIFTPLFRK